jgi:type I restriction enzyme S subunit
MSFDKTIPLNEYITLQRGFDLPKKDRADGVVPVVASTGIGGYHNKAKVKAPGVVIGRSGSIGGGQYITEDFWPLNTTLWVKDFKNHHPRYVYYLLRSIDFTHFNVGSGVPTLNRNHLSSILVADIGYKNEERIAKIIGDLDDKIELNTQTNQTLEQIAQAIFKSWFVDFEPVKAKMAVLAAGGTAQQAELAAMSVISAKDETALKQLQTEHPEADAQGSANVAEGRMPGVTYAELAQTAALFPSAMVESELGEIPMGWDVLLFKKVIDKYVDNRGKTPPLVDDGIPLVEVKHLLESTAFPTLDTEKQISQETFDTWFRAYVKEKDILISTVGTIGRTSFVKNTNFGIAQNVLGFRFGTIAEPEFMFYTIKARRFQHDMKARLITTVQSSIKRKDLDTIDILIPCKGIQIAFCRLVGTLLDAQFSKNTENIELTKLRDTFLPKLLSGEIDLGVRQGFVEETA